jgi:hypothetical protein
MIMARSNRVYNWLVQQWQWPAATLFAACFLLAMAPLMYLVAGPVLTVVFLFLPVYMLHQCEEHTGDRFRKDINLHIAGGREALTPRATFWINSLGVWGVDLIAVYLAAFVRPSLGLIAVYMALVNGVLHIVSSVVRREYNPGLWTAMALFLPFGGFGILVLNAAGADWEAHAIGFGAAAAVHVAIVVHVVRRIAYLSHATGRNNGCQSSAGQHPVAG